MQIYRGLSEIPADAPRVVATIGNFDGVHRGHEWVMRRVRSRAAELGAGSMVITFDPHPSRVLRPESACPLITPLEQKLELLAATGVDTTVVLPFDAKMARTSARAFASEVLRDRLKVAELHEGENFRFGYEAEAGVETLKQLGDELGFRVFSYAPRQFRGGPVSSSRVRTLLSEGDVSGARSLLGRPFAVRSTPASGRGYGTRYTVPTINLAPYTELLPANGVYVTKMRVGAGEAAEVFDAVTNVGNRPTFGEDSFTVETHLLNFHPLELLAATPLELCFLDRLRAEQRWPDPEALRQQIGRDVQRAQRYFSLLRVLAKPRQ
jgi:riboflavin kinase/FMN adenylyltransferase